ncbi:hypothetical protein H5410_060705 [Solanum commersonii]|uniref:Uncharacterized protein n=1 Tax=Solanum commersonii TaxID=4109 RepID=A0A9J5W5S4_SOLCO|nr:hypothetical protein H5410_060705 [Solanum commersonii]
MALICHYLWRASGITTELQLYCTAIGALVFAAGAKIGLASRYRIYVDSPFGRATRTWVSLLGGASNLLGQLYPSFAKGATLFFTLNWSKYADFLTFRGGLDLVTGSLWLTDMAHHHLPTRGHKGLYEILTTSWHAQLYLNLAMLGYLTIVVAHHMYYMPPYPYRATDYGTQLSLFKHHMWIGGFLIVGVATHAAIFMVRDYDPTTQYNDLLDRVLRHRDAIISHLNWAYIFLGFHCFDTAIQLQPIFAQWIQNTHALSPGATAPSVTTNTSLTCGGGGDLVAVGGKVALLPIPLGTDDFLVYHIHAFTIHVTY